MSKRNRCSVAVLVIAAGLSSIANQVDAEPAWRHGPHPLTVRHHLGAWPAPLVPAAPLVVPLDPTGGIVIQTPFTLVPGPDGPVAVRIPHRQGPDGSYDDLADLTNDIQGTPCGRECTARSLVRWGYLPAE